PVSTTLACWTASGPPPTVLVLRKSTLALNFLRFRTGPAGGTICAPESEKKKAGAAVRSTPDGRAPGSGPSTGAGATARSGKTTKRTAVLRNAERFGMGLL